MASIAVLFFITAVTFTDARSWIDLLDTSDEGRDDTPPNVYCLVRFYMCSKKLSVEPKVPVFNRTGVHFTKANVDNICSIGAEFVPCIETDRPGKKVKCYGTERARRLRRMYDVMCVNNKTDMYNLISCVNDMRVQLAAFGCASGTEARRHMLRYVDEEAPLTEEIYQQLLCYSLHEMKRCVSSTVQEFCGERDAAIIDNLMDAIPMAYSFLSDYYYDVTYCEDFQF